VVGTCCAVTAPFADPYRIPETAIEIVAGTAYLLGRLLFMIGLLVLPMRILRRSERLGVALDAAMVCISTGIILAAAMATPVTVLARGGIIRLVFSVVTSAVNFGLLAVLAELFFIQAYTRRSLMTILLLLSAGVNVVADTAFILEVFTGGFKPGGLEATASVASATLAGLAACAQLEWARSGGKERRTRRQPGIRVSVAFQHLPMMWVAALAGMTLWNRYHPLWIPSAHLLWGTAAVIILAMVRLAVASSANLHLAGDVKTSQRQYDIIAENSADVIWVRDPDLQLVYLSPSVQRLRGISVDEAIARDSASCAAAGSSSAERENFRKLLQQARQEGPFPGGSAAQGSLEYELPRADGNMVWVETSYRFTTDEEGVLNGLVGVTRDIGRRKRAKEELRRLNAELECRVARRTAELQEALDSVRALKELLPICSS
jgi:PAS domain S-box-containing protein